MALPESANQIMTADELRWELRLQPNKPADSVLEGIIRRAIAWIVLNTGVPVLPISETYRLVYGEEGINKGHSEKQITVGIPNVVRLAGISLDDVQQQMSDYRASLYDSSYLCIERADKARLFRYNETFVLLTVYRGIPLGSDTLENCKSLIAAIGRELFDGLAFRNRIHMTLAMSSIIDRLAAKQAPFLNVVKYQNAEIGEDIINNRLVYGDGTIFWS